MDLSSVSQFTVSIAGTERTAFVVDDMRLSTNMVRDNKLELNLAILQSELVEVRLNEQLLLSYGGRVLFGGVIHAISQEPSRNAYKAQLFVRLECVSYRRIANRRNVFVQTNPENPAMIGDIVKNVLDNALASDGITEGSIQADVAVTTDFVFEHGTVSELLDNLAELGGFNWVITETGKLYFGVGFPVASSLPNPNIASKNFEILESSRTLDDYANKAFVIGDNFKTIFEDAEEIGRLGGRFGSGVVGRTLRTSVKDEDLGLGAGMGFLNQHSFEKQSFRIRVVGFVQICAQIDIEWQGTTFKTFVTEVEVSVSGGLLISECTLVSAPTLPKNIDITAWLDMTATLVSKNNANSQKIQTAARNVLVDSTQAVQAVQLDVANIQATFVLTKKDKPLIFFKFTLQLVESGTVGNNATITCYIDNVAVYTTRTLASTTERVEETVSGTVTPYVDVSVFLPVSSYFVPRAALSAGRHVAKVNVSGGHITNQEMTVVSQCLYVPVPETLVHVVGAGKASLRQAGSAYVDDGQTIYQY